jgi:hypothetical protein
MKSKRFAVSLQDEILPGISLGSKPDGIAPNSNPTHQKAALKF